MKPELKKYRVLGLMSGTSLDGLDMALCTFRRKKGRWAFKIRAAETVRYSGEWIRKLSFAHTLPGEGLMMLDQEYGDYLGRATVQFLKKHKEVPPDVLASHGHTIFHQPGRRLTFQLGSGYALHAITGIPTVFGFRNLDVALGGEGAPLVPVGDQLLFSGFDVCLNFGGIANMSLEHRGKRLAFDVCFANMGLNYLSAKAGLEYDQNGRLSSRGKVHSQMLEAVSRVYDKMRSSRPSLGREVFERQIKPILDLEEISLEDRLRTFTESIALEIVRSIPQRGKARVLCTGGGALNTYLLRRLREHSGDKLDWHLPDRQTIKFKEALVFAFLGLLRVLEEVNSLKSVTRARRDNSGGAILGTPIF
jgi:anhydro-N-acetylmuramic acid kinase